MRVYEAMKNIPISELIKLQPYQLDFLKMAAKRLKDVQALVWLGRINNYKRKTTANELN